MRIMPRRSAAATPQSNIFCCVSRRLMFEISRRAVLVKPPTSKTYEKKGGKKKREEGVSLCVCVRVVLVRYFTKCTDGKEGVCVCVSHQNQRLAIFFTSLSACPVRDFTSPTCVF